jgi:uncharacterized protein (TIGR00369 family)
MEERILRKCEELKAAGGFIRKSGIIFEEIDEGYARGRIDIDDTALNPAGTIHGGCIFTLADTIGGTAAMTRGNNVTTISSSIEYLSPGNDAAYIIAEAQEIKNGKTISVYDVNVYNDKGKKLSKVTLSYFKLQEIE